jgi:hypothetical protein
MSVQRLEEVIQFFLKLNSNKNNQNQKRATRISTTSLKVCFIRKNHGNLKRPPLAEAAPSSRSHFPFPVERQRRAATTPALPHTLAPNVRVSSSYLCVCV